MRNLKIKKSFIVLKPKSCRFHIQISNIIYSNHCFKNTLTLTVFLNTYKSPVPIRYHSHIYNMLINTNPGRHRSNHCLTVQSGVGYIARDVPPPLVTTASCREGMRWKRDLQNMNDIMLSVTSVWELEKKRSEGQSVCMRLFV